MSLAAGGHVFSISALSRFFQRRRITLKKDHVRRRAGTAGRPEKGEEEWFDGQIDLDPSSLSSSTRHGHRPIWRGLRGRAPRGERLRAFIPHGHWKTTTFVAGLRLSGMVAPMVLDGPINGQAFQAYVDQGPCPRSSERRHRCYGQSPAAIRAPACARRSRLQAPSFSISRPTAPTSTRSKTPSPSSKRCCAPLLNAPSKACWSAIGRCLSRFTPRECADVPSKPLDTSQPDQGNALTARAKQDRNH